MKWRHGGGRHVGKRMLGRRNRERKPRFPLPPPETCEACNHPTDDPHTITESFDEGDGTGTEMTAIYCPAHCEGGCDKEHVHAA